MSSSQTDANPSEKKRKEGVLTEGNLWKAIWVMSWPLMLTTICSSLVGLTDVKVAGTLGPAQQAAVGISEQVLFLYMIFIMATGVGTTALVSRAAGAGDQPEVIRVTAQSITLSVIVGLVLTLISLIFARFGVSLFSKAPDVIAQSTAYLIVYSFYLIPFSITAIINAAFRALGDTKTPLILVGIMTTVNIIGDILTVIYKWPVPDLGVRGIALSGVLASCLGSLLAIAFVVRSPKLNESLNEIFKVNLDTLQRVVKVGIPSGLQRLAWAMSVFALFFILARGAHPTESLASWTIGMRLEGLVFMPLMALSMAVSSIVGQNLGAEQTDRAVRAGWNVAAIGVGLNCVLGTCMFVFSNALANSMSTDPNTVLYTADYLKINAFCEPFLALGMVLSGGLQGAGDTKTPMWITLFTNWILRLPLAWYLVITINMGPIGAWLAMSISCVVMGLLTAWRFQSKAWIKIQV
ncbi:MAG: MATE family efflux transporter [Candidatus Melainabacteria bacterium]|nr:MAG: MATE family efflux transporter [Candidatus Melainabacteria bacterium]